MKLVRFGAPGEERPGIWLEATKKEPARIVDVRAMVFDIEDYDQRFWTTYGVERLKGLLDEMALKTLPAEGVRLGPPVARPRQIICLGKTTVTTPKSSTPRFRIIPSISPKVPGRSAARPIPSICALAWSAWMPKPNWRWSLDGACGMCRRRRRSPMWQAIPS